MIRGTNDGEWYSNFDFAPSHSADAVFAENFLFAAQNVFLSLDEILKGEENPLLLVAGHSRGAACANLLGVLLDAAYDPANVLPSIPSLRPRLSAAQRRSRNTPTFSITSTPATW